MAARGVPVDLEVARKHVKHLRDYCDERIPLVENERTEMNIYERIAAFIEPLRKACAKVGLPFRPDVDIAIFAHPEALRPFAIEAGKDQSQIVLPGPYERGWMVKWRGIHVIEDRICAKDRISIHLGFMPAVHFKLDGETIEAIEPVTTELPKKYRAVVRKLLAETQD